MIPQQEPAEVSLARKPAEPQTNNADAKEIAAGQLSLNVDKKEQGVSGDAKDKPEPELGTEGAGNGISKLNTNLISEKPPDKPAIKTDWAFIELHADI